MQQKNREVSVKPLGDLETSGDVELPSYAVEYYHQVCSDYQMATGASDPCATNKNPKWEDLYQLEMLLLAKRNEEDLRRTAWTVRLRFRNIAGEANYQAYLASSPPDPATASRAELLADLQSLVRRTYYMLVLLPASEAVRRKLLLGAALAGAFFVGIIVAVSFFPNRLLLFHLVLLAGAVGGTMSLIQRLLQLTDGDPLLLRMSARASFIQSAIIPPIAGAIFAALVFMLSASGLITGPTFPAFTKPHGGPVTDIMQAIWDLSPVNGAQAALLLVWSFIAGFAERFVPDTITRLIEKQESRSTAAGPHP